MASLIKVVLFSSVVAISAEGDDWYAKFKECTSLGICTCNGVETRVQHASECGEDCSYRGKCWELTPKSVKNACYEECVSRLPTEASIRRNRCFFHFKNCSQYPCEGYKGRSENDPNPEEQKKSRCIEYVKDETFPVIPTEFVNYQAKVNDCTDNTCRSDALKEVNMLTQACIINCRGDNFCRIECWWNKDTSQGGSSEDFNKLVDLLEAQTKRLSTLESDIKAKRDEDRNNLYSSFQSIMQLQMTMDERTRRTSQSGITAVRSETIGAQSYHAPHFAPSFIAMHDHADHKYTVGMGEFAAVMHGTTFRTRHNDYPLKQAVPGDDVTELIDHPDVPPAVLAESTVEGQIRVMQEYFKAFNEQDASIREDYQDYFKPVLCYLEGAWEWRTDEMPETESDRHHTEARNWRDLQRKMQFFEMGGTKNLDENVPFTPASIFDVEIGEDNKITPKIAQWTYRVKCQPLKEDPRKAIKTRPDAAAMKRHKFKSEEHYKMSRSARFFIDPYDGNKQSGKRDYLDTLMEQIPGRDGCKEDLEDNVFTSYPYGDESSTPLNTCRYTRFIRFEGTDAMGQKNMRRGWNDPFMFAAMTTSEKVASATITNVPRGKFNKDKDCSDCEEVTQKWTYALPLEIIYLTPLNKWNPYNIRAEPDDMKKKEWLKTQEGRNGTKDKPYTSVQQNGYWYRTPVEFFGSCDTESDSSAADTSGKVKHFVGDDGVTRKVGASGTYIVTPCIGGVGKARLRYPIAPLAEEGTAVWKELKAVEAQLQDRLVNLEPTSAERTLAESPQPVTSPSMLILSKMEDRVLHGHWHELEIDAAQGASEDQIRSQRPGTVLRVTATARSSDGEDHMVQFRSLKGKESFRGQASWTFILTKCDEYEEEDCETWDHHNTVSFREQLEPMFV